MGPETESSMATKASIRSEEARRSWPLPVGAGHDQGICQVSGTVINSCCVTGGDDTVYVQFWSAVNNAHKHACTHTDSYDQAEGTQNQTGFKESKKNRVVYFLLREPQPYFFRLLFP